MKKHLIKLNITYVRLMYSTCRLNGLILKHAFFSQCSLFPAVSCLLLLFSLAIHPGEIFKQCSVSVTGMHINCDNEGHPEEQLESSSVSSTLSVGKLVLGVFPHRTSDKHHMLPTYTLTPLSGLPLCSSIMEARDIQKCEILRGLKSKISLGQNYIKLITCIFY